MQTHRQLTRSLSPLGAWAFIGFESISHSAEEVRFQRTAFFQVLVVSVALTTALYIFVTLLSVTAYPPEYASWLDYIRDRDNLEGIKGLPAFYAAWRYMGDAGVSAFFPLLGRTAIGWIVDVTTIGATLIYALVSAAVMKLARERRDRAERMLGMAGVVAMAVFGLCLIVPNLYTTGNMARESYFLFAVWAVLGFIYFRSILKRDQTRRFGNSIVVWISLFSMILFVSLVWLCQSMLGATSAGLNAVVRHYAEAGAFGIVICDLNGLKHVNDTLGHKAGDERIKQASKVICDRFSHSPVYRNGGDEFVVYLAGRDFEDRHDILRAMHDASVANIETDGIVIAVGLAEYDPGRDQRLRTVFERADAAMYREKTAFKGMGAVTR